MKYFKVFCSLIHEEVEPILIKAPDEEGASNYLWEEMCDTYDSYAGLHGTPDEQDIINEYIQENGEEPDEDILFELYCENVNTWIDGYYEEISEEEYNKLIK